MVTGRIHSFQSLGAVDGPGLRFVVFLQGCPLRCMYCHNPDTWNGNGGDLDRFSMPTGITMGPDGSIWVVDTENNRVNKFVLPALPAGE